MFLAKFRTGSLLAVALLAGSLHLSGCATTVGAEPHDPAEGFNRAVFAFNEGLDKALIKPVALGYDAVAPTFVRTGVSNFFGNIADLFIAVNNVLQGKPAEAVGDVARFAFNSTFGVFGFFDVASAMGLEKHEEDFGQTMGKWGMEAGPYLVLPVFGPRDVRDAAGLAVDVYADPVGYLDSVPTRNSLTALRLINERADLLPAEKVIEEAALDKYAYIRDAYLQRRRSLVYDGQPPREPDVE